MTAKQTRLCDAANEADLALYRLSGALDALANVTHDPDIDELSRHLFGARGCVRKYMNPADREGTEA